MKLWAKGNLKYQIVRASNLLCISINSHHTLKLLMLVKFSLTMFTNKNQTLDIFQQTLIHMKTS